MKEITRDQFYTYLNTTPTTQSEIWSLLGVGITDYGIAYNPQINTEKWIINKNASSSHKGNQKQGSVSQTCYAGDPVFEYIATLRDKDGAEVQTDILDVDSWNGNEGTFPAKKSKVIVAITQFMNDEAVIEYDIYYNGDAEEGTVTIADGVPTFVKGGSL